MSIKKITAKHIKAANPPQFAKLLGVTTSSVYRWLEGVAPNLKILQESSKRLDISFIELLDLYEFWINEEIERRNLQGEINLYLESHDVSKAA